VSAVRRAIARVAAVFRRADLDRDLDDELATHVELATEENLQRGMTAADARRAAVASLGSPIAAREQHRESRGLPGLDSILQDLRYGIRGMRRDAGLTAFAVLIIGLGVGASSTVFNVFNALLLRPLPFTDSTRLAWIANGELENLSAQTVQVDNLLDFRRQSQSFAAVEGYSPFYGQGDVRLTGADQPERLTAVPVTERFFPLLGIEPVLGRVFTAEESLWNAPPTAILSHRFWVRCFAAAPDVVGTAMVLDGAPVTVVGVLPESFDFTAVFAPGTGADLFVPYPLSPETNRRGNTLALLGRLNPGVRVDEAQVEADLIAERIRGAERRNEFRPTIAPLRERVSGEFRRALLVLAGAVGFLMLLVCANLSNLLLARASGRHREMAIRAALGAGRPRLVRQMLIESLCLSSVGAAVGLALAVGGTRLVAGIEGMSVPLLQAVRVDLDVLGFCLLVAVATGIVVGLAPALQTSALAPHLALKQGGRGAVGGSGRDWMRRSLVVCEVALACLLVTGAALFGRSLVRVLEVDLGFRTDDILALRIDPGREYSTHAQRTAYFDQILDRVRAVPGVEAVGLTDALPLGDNYGWRLWNVGVAGRAYDRGQKPLALVRIVDDGYIPAMRITVDAGRTFSANDTSESEPVIIVNEPLARRLWPEADPVGRRVEIMGRERRVVGVVREVRYFALEQASGPEMYLPIRQIPDYSSVDLVVSASLPPAAMAPGLRAALAEIDPTLPAADFRTMR
jgi:predicted permease|tara:strand:+ start:2694 stop:4922 length:2229 start_codon:yes stop_codon:yes gene_type:complete